MADVEKLRTLGTEWQKAGKHRIYFNDLPSWYGLVCEAYGTGNVRSAKLDGEPISNTKARTILSDLATCKLYYDYADNQFHLLSNYTRNDTAAYLAALVARIETAAQ